MMVAVRSIDIDNNTDTNFQCAIPTACAEGHTISTDSKTTDTVFMPSQNSNTLTLERIPNIASPIIISAK